MSEPLYVHVGCGDQRLPGWVNVDRQPLPSVDRVVDVTQGLPFEDVEALFAEHFLEHLPLDEALAFLLETHRVLAPGGRLRLTTPNLDWVVAAHYAVGVPEAEARARALHLNRAFHGWSHRFLWNREILAEALVASGFDEVRFCDRGESDWPPFRGLERHVPYQDLPGLPHVLVVEARKGAAQPERLAAMRALARELFLDDVRPRGWQLDPARSSVIAHLGLGGPLGRLVREHVVRAAWVGGSLHVYPEAPEEARVIVDIDTRHLLGDEPVLRAGGRLPRLPSRLQRRIEAQLRGARYFDVERWPRIRFASDALSRHTGGRCTLAGTLELRGAALPLTVEAMTTFEHGVWRARGRLALRPSTLGLPRWRLAGGLVADTDSMVVDFDLVAAPASPT